MQMVVLETVGGDGWVFQGFLGGILNERGCPFGAFLTGTEFRSRGNLQRVLMAGEERDSGCLPGPHYSVKFHFVEL